MSTPANPSNPSNPFGSFGFGDPDGRLAAYMARVAKDAAILEIQLLNETNANGWAAPDPDEAADAPAAKPTAPTKGTV